MDRFDPYYFSRLRYNLPDADPLHGVIAPLEHREFTREAVSRNPAMALPIGLAIPPYTLLKYLGLLPKEKNTSPASWDELFAGYEGLFSGLLNRDRNTER